MAFTLGAREINPGGASQSSQSRWEHSGVAQSRNILGIVQVTGTRLCPAWEDGERGWLQGKEFGRDEKRGGFETEARQCLGTGFLGYGNCAGRQPGTGTVIHPGGSGSRERAQGVK